LETAEDGHIVSKRGAAQLHSVIAAVTLILGRLSMSRCRGREQKKSGESKFDHDSPPSVRRGNPLTDPLFLSGAALSRMLKISLRA
jgi:hypothetical protein